MSANGTRLIEWAGGEDAFCLAKVGHIFDLEDKCKAGIGVIAARLESGAYYFNDIRETIRLGLIGGGKTPEQAMAAVKAHVDPPNPLSHCQIVAYAIIQAALIGVPEDPVGIKDDDPGKAEPAEAPQAGFSTTTDASAAPKY